jgi:LmbE family N-acetylglucosaminyl deacetylase
MPDVVMALAPHPDDAEIYCGGALAKLVAEGAAVTIVVATDGCKGSFIEESGSLAALRAEEMRRAAAALGAQPPVLLGFPDMGLDALAPGVLREKFVAAIREIRPDIVFAQDPYALYEPHPDHRAVAWAAIEAINCSQLPLVFPEHLDAGLQPHLVREKYFYGDILPGANKIVDTTAFVDRKIAAIAEHRSQVVYIVEGILRQAALAGLEMKQVAVGTAQSPIELLAWGLRSRDAETGRKIGVPFAEEYRWVRYHRLAEEALAQMGRGA